jgi:MSHA biogenesis protein MshP
MSRRRLAGGALLTAIFLIVILLGMGLGMMNLAGIQHDTSSKSMLSANVYFGAKAGLDWGIQQAIAASSCAGSSSFSLSQGALNGVSITVTCSESRHGAASGESVFYITSRATTGTLGQLSYAERRMEATVSNIP